MMKKFSVLFVSFLLLFGFGPTSKAFIGCDGMCTSSTWTLTKHSTTITSDDTTCCNVFIYSRYRTCYDSLYGKSINEIEILRIVPQDGITTCICDPNNTMRYVIKFILNLAPSLFDSNFTSGYKEIYLRTGKCWYFDVLDSSAFKNCDTINLCCYQTKYNLYVYNGYGTYIINHNIQESQCEACNVGMGCYNVQVSHNLQDGFIYQTTLPCSPNDCYWTTLGNTNTSDANFLGTLQNNPLIIKTNSNERIKIFEDYNFGVNEERGRIDFKVSRFTSSKISFDNSTLNGGNPANPVIKMYRTIGGTNAKPWWLEAGLVGNDYRLDIKTGPTSAIGSEIVSPVISIVSYTDYSTANVGIGVENPQEKLVVDGTICAKEMRVSLSGAPCWSDHVFGQNYNLRTIDEVEQFIKNNKHLPDIPSVNEVEANGIELGVMQAKLLKKIEELTLYVIELKKDNEQLKKEVKQIKGRRKGK